MQRKNIFDLLALKEKVASNKFLQRMQPLKEEKIKVEKILVQLKELKNDGITNLSTSAWELKSASNIQEKIFNQISLAKLRLEKINSEIFQLERKFIEHEIRKSRSEEKSKQIKKSLSIEKENKADAEIQGINKVKIN
jgi:hypothetical protein